MGKKIPIGCIQCEVVGEVETTKNGYRCGECGATWLKAGKKAASKAAPKKGG